jgi:hypothetical protein
VVVPVVIYMFVVMHTQTLCLSHLIFFIIIKMTHRGPFLVVTHTRTHTLPFTHTHTHSLSLCIFVITKIMPSILLYPSERCAVVKDISQSLSQKVSYTSSKKKKIGKNLSTRGTGRHATASALPSCIASPRKEPKVP